MRLLAVACVMVGCAGTQTSGPLSAPALMRDVRELADPRYEGRQAGTAGEALAVAYVVGRLKALGLEPIEQPVQLWDSRTSTNVHALLLGKRPDDVVVVGAHLNHLGVDHPGADDNASGVAVVLAIAEALVARQDELDRSVMFVLFGAEEEGLVGSRFFVEHAPVPLDHIPAMVNLDMVGRPLIDQWKLRAPLYLFGIDRDRACGLVGTRHHPGLRALADAAFAAEDAEVVAAEDLPARIDAEVTEQSDDRSDATSFENAGVPAMFFGDGESRDYHSPGDTVDRLAPDVMARRARAIARLVVALSGAPAAAFARTDATPPRRKPPRGWYVPFGFVTGAAFTADDASYFLGGEVSVLHLSPGSLLYAGVYGDAIRDTGANLTRLSFGPELGRRFFGLDAGYLLELDGGEVTDRGVVLRAFFGLSPATVTLRAGYLADRGGFAELGIALKFPLRLSAL